MKFEYIFYIRPGAADQYLVLDFIDYINDGTTHMNTTFSIEILLIM